MVYFNNVTTILFTLVNKFISQCHSPNPIQELNQCNCQTFRVDLAILNIAFTQISNYYRVNASTFRFWAETKNGGNQAQGQDLESLSLRNIFSQIHQLFSSAFDKVINDKIKTKNGRTIKNKYLSRLLLFSQTRKTKTNKQRK